MQEEAAEKMDDLLTLIEVNDEFHMIMETGKTN